MRVRRITSRAVMIVVLVVAVQWAFLAAMAARRARLLQIAREHAAASTGDPQRAGWHHRMHDKYRSAARRPWLPVAPDPPEPK